MGSRVAFIEQTVQPSELREEPRAPSRPSPTTVTSCEAENACRASQSTPQLTHLERDQYQKSRLFAADALLLGRATYQNFSQAYPAMEKTGEGAPMDFVRRMNSIPKYVASTTLGEASWNATVLRGDVADEVRKIKSQPGKDIIKYGTGSLDRVLLGQKLVDVLCIILYPFVLGHGTHLLEELGVMTHLRLSDVTRFESGTVVLEYVPKE